MLPVNKKRCIGKVFDFGLPVVAAGAWIKVPAGEKVSACIECYGRLFGDAGRNINIIIEVGRLSQKVLKQIQAGIEALLGEIFGNDVDDSAEGIGSVNNTHWPFNDFHALNIGKHNLAHIYIAIDSANDRNSIDEDFDVRQFPA